jgi:hypothetical protein
VALTKSMPNHGNNVSLSNRFGTPTARRAGSGHGAVDYEQRESDEYA